MIFCKSNLFIIEQNSSKSNILARILNFQSSVPVRVSRCPPTGTAVRRSPGSLISKFRTVRQHKRNRTMNIQSCKQHCSWVHLVLVTCFSTFVLDSSELFHWKLEVIFKTRNYAFNNSSQCTNFSAQSSFHLQYHS